MSRINELKMMEAYAYSSPDKTVKDILNYFRNTYIDRDNLAANYTEYDGFSPIVYEAFPKHDILHIRGRNGTRPRDEGAQAALDHGFDSTALPKAFANKASKKVEFTLLSDASYYKKNYKVPESRSFISNLTTRVNFAIGCYTRLFFEEYYDYVKDNKLNKKEDAQFINHLRHNDSEVTSFKLLSEDNNLETILGAHANLCIIEKTERKFIISKALELSNFRKENKVNLNLPFREEKINQMMRALEPSIDDGYEIFR